MKKSVNKHQHLCIIMPTKAIWFISKREYFPKSDPIAPNIRFDVEFSSLEVLGGHPGPRNEAALSLLIV